MSPQLDGSDGGGDPVAENGDGAPGAVRFKGRIGRGHPGEYRAESVENNVQPQSAAGAVGRGGRLSQPAPHSTQYSSWFGGTGPEDPDKIIWVRGGGIGIASACGEEGTNRRRRRPRSATDPAQAIGRRDSRCGRRAGRGPQPDGRAA